MRNIGKEIVQNGIILANFKSTIIFFTIMQISVFFDRENKEKTIELGK